MFRVESWHCFNDGNKRTAHQTMDVCLDINGVEINWTATDIGPLIITLAQGKIDEARFAAELRKRAGL